MPAGMGNSNRTNLWMMSGTECHLLDLPDLDLVQGALSEHPLQEQSQA